MQGFLRQNNRNCNQRYIWGLLVDYDHPNIFNFWGTAYLLCVLVRPMTSSQKDHIAYLATTNAHLLESRTAKTLNMVVVKGHVRDSEKLLREAKDFSKKGKPWQKKAKPSSSKDVV